MVDTGRPTNMEQYIISHFDEALQKGWLRVYLQPVVRTLTRQVCGFEALSRWLDPEYGMLMPGEFISVLEKHRRIHELDAYVLRTVCENYRIDKDRIDVPVSVNFSRLDYELCDVFALVESAVKANKVPRSILCIEITESILARNEELMHQYIDRFRSAGYAVWMDDFGSGYSSLNVLKDYMFDELKIDMRFLSDTSTRSKRILASIIHMAKQIKIQTLAEGVETEEMYQYLRSIGCEKVQGHLFGMPMPFDQCMDFFKHRGMTWESPVMRGYYDEIGQLNVLSPNPFRSPAALDMPITGRDLNSIALSIVELQGEEAQMLYSNLAFERTSAALDWPLAWNHQEGSASIPLRQVSQRLHGLLEQARADGESRLLTVFNNDYYEMYAFRLARRRSSCAVVVSVKNLSQMSAMVNQQQLDEGLRSLYSVYEQVSLIDLHALTLESLYLEHDSEHEMHSCSLLDWVEEYARQRLFPDDQERFRNFLQPQTLEARTSRVGGISTHLRVLSLHGAYEWKSHQVVRIRRNVYYLLIRGAEEEVLELKSTYEAQRQSNETITPWLLWENVVNNYDLKFFWKDRERRFVGASRAFLNHYEFQSVAAILGKTDEDMGWHIHNDPFRDEEWKVIHEGIVSKRVAGNCIVQGEDKAIVATKMPLYSQDGKIVGLIGSFYETDAQSPDKKAQKQSRTDELTGLLNSRGLAEDLYAYIDEYDLRGRDFARIEVAIDGFADINARYGYDFGDAVIRETGRALRRTCGNTATVARSSGYYYTVLRQFEDREELDDLVERIRQIPAQLHQIDGTPFTIYLSVGSALYSETKNQNAMTAQAEMRRMTDDVEGISQHQLMENTKRIFNMFDELPLSYAVYKIVDGPEGKDAVVLYANRAFQEMTKLSPDILVGKRVSSFFALDANNWLLMAERAGLEGKSINGRFHDVFMDVDFAIKAYPVIGPGFCAFTFQIAT